jgi:hypothetical protein
MVAYKMHGVFILFEGLPSTVIDSQVLTHVRLARERLGIDLTVIAVACTDAIYRASSARLERARKIAGGEVHLLRGGRPMLPGSMLINRLLLARKLDAMSPISFIHARTDYAAAVSGPLARRRDIPMLWDCRGDMIAELRERLSGSHAVVRMLMEIRERLMRKERSLAGKGCAAACFVTRELEELMGEHIGRKPRWIIPCLAAEDKFYVSASLRDRQRAELEISADETVYIYSGSLAAYQCFEETVDLFRRMVADGGKVRLIVLAPEVEAARQITKDFPENRVICKSAAHNEVNAFLNAADFGMLLREPTPVNHVAFPTKFAEYSLTGLQVVMKAGPPSCVDVAKALGNYVSIDRAGGRPWSSDERKKCADAAIASLGRIARMQTYADVYRTLSAMSRVDVRPAA